jgi:hypothetical protein
MKIRILLDVTPFRIRIYKKTNKAAEAEHSQARITRISNSL